jgi:hypothetical protein
MKVNGQLPWPLYLAGKSPRYPLDRRLCGPQNHSEQHKEKNILAPIGTQTPTPAVQLVASHYTNYTTPAPYLMKTTNNDTISKQITFKINIFCDVTVIFIQPTMIASNLRSHNFVNYWKGKAIPCTGHGGP